MGDQAEEIFAELLDIAPAHRGRYIVELCKGDAELQAEVEGLLRDAERADTFFEAFTQGAPGLPNQNLFIARDKPGAEIGVYRLIRLLGRGGFGTVWHAEQTEPLRRQVALKIIKRGMDSEDVLARFRTEQQALAMMNHPHIARVFDAGVAPDGRPYFAMEFVEGERITTFCDTRSLSIQDRLRLFLQVCSAVNHAHQKGVIHRDLKPSNILVTCKGGETIAKVIDFGIAKAIEGSISGDRTITQADQFVGTPTYMSPEQVAGRKDSIDTRTDVYSLGIVLYELLVGSAPFDEKTLATAGREEILRIIREKDPVRPSTKLKNLPDDAQTTVAAARKVAPALLPRLVMAELDWIAMKAIDKSKERRYETIDALASDIQHYLNNEPVMARPPSTAYLLNKMARRHRVLLATTSAIVLTLCVATVISVWLALRAKQAESLAAERLHQVLDEQAAREKARQQAEEVSNFIVDLFHKPHPNRDGRNVTAAEVLLGAENDISTKLANQPARAILLKRTLADTYFGLGLYPESLRLRKNIYEESKSLFPETNAEVLDDLSALGTLFFQLGCYGEALGYFQREVELRKQQSPRNPEKLKLAENGLTNCIFHTEEREQSKKLQGQAVEDTRQKTCEFSATQPRVDSEVSNWMGRAASRFFWSGERISAIEMQLDLLPRLEEKYGKDHMARIEASEALIFYSLRAWHMAKEQSPEQSIRESRKRLFEPEYMKTLAAEVIEAPIMFFMGKTSEALQSLERIVPLLNKVAGRSRITLNAESTLARCYLAEGRTPEAIAIFKDCLPHMRDDSFVSSVLAQLLVWENRTEEYRELRNATLDYAWRERNQMGTRPDIFERQMLLACLQPFESEDQAEKVREIIRIGKYFREISNLPELADNDYQHMIYGIVAYRSGDYEEARRCFELVPDINHSRFFKINNANAVKLFLAMTLAAQGDMNAATRLYTETRRNMSDPPSIAHPLTNNNHPGGDQDYLFVLLVQREADEFFKKFEPDSPQP